MRRTSGRDDEGLELAAIALDAAAARGEGDHQAERLDVEPRQQVERAGIEPLHVVEDQQGRLARRGVGQGALHGGHRVLGAHRAFHVAGEIAVGQRYRQHVAEQRRQRRDVGKADRPVGDGMQDGGAVGAGLEPEQRRERLAPGPERRAAFERIGRADQHLETLLEGLLGHAAQQRALADAGFSLDQRQGAAAVADAAVDERQQLRQFAATTDDVARFAAAGTAGARAEEPRVRRQAFAGRAGQRLEGDAMAGGACGLGVADDAMAADVAERRGEIHRRADHRVDLPLLAADRPAQGDAGRHAAGAVEP